MIEGHGDDLYKYGKKIVSNFSSNVYNRIDHSGLYQRLNERLSTICSYPEPMPYSLESEIARRYSLTPRQVCVTNGATEAIYLIAQVFQGRISAVLGPTFSEYADACRVHRHKVKPFYSLDALPEDAELVWICNPNNPTGTYVPIGELEAFADTLPEDVLLVMDEAYMEFATEPDCCSMVDYMKAHPEKPILVLRTFSKYYAMAGLRVGYALGSEELIGIMRKCSASWNLNVCAQKAAVAGLADQEYYQEQKAKIVEGREYLEKEMAALGCRVYPSQSNFIYFDTGKDPAWIQEQLMEKGIRIGAFEMSRVSVGTMEECKLYIKALKEILEAAE